MNGFQQALGRAVASKAEMYGFPLIVWSSGGLRGCTSTRRGWAGSRRVQRGSD